MKVGVLALQGGFFEHLKMIEHCEHQGIMVKKAEDLKTIQRLIIPGGESTTIGKLLERYQLDEKIIELYHKSNIPILGTCAGMIVLSKKIEGEKQKTMGLINVTVKRNAFGRQINSFEADLEIKSITPPTFRGIFIRAPFITKIGQKVSVLSCYNDRPVFAREGNIFVASFHPELTDDLRLHRFFIERSKF